MTLMSVLAALVAGALVVGGSDAFVASSSFTGTMLQQSARVDSQVPRQNLLACASIVPTTASLAVLYLLSSRSMHW